MGCCAGCLVAENTGRHNEHGTQKTSAENMDYVENLASSHASQSGIFFFFTCILKSLRS